MSRPRRANTSSVTKPFVSVARSSPLPDEAKRSIHLTVKMPSSKLREATGVSEKVAPSGSRGGGSILSAPTRASRAKRSVVIESESESEEEEDEGDDDAEGEDDDEAEDDDENLEEDEGYEDPDAEGEAEDQDADADVDADSDIDMEDADARPPPPVLKITGPSSKPAISVTPAQVGKAKSVEGKEVEMADDGDEDLSDLGSEGDEDDLEQEDEGRGGDDESRSSTPDVSKMTKRQRSRLDQVMGGDFLQLPMEPQIKKHLTAEEHAMRRAEMARRRKNLSEKRNEEEKVGFLHQLANTGLTFC